MNKKNILINTIRLFSLVPILFFFYSGSVDLLFSGYFVFALVIGIFAFAPLLLLLGNYENINNKTIGLSIFLLLVNIIAILL